YGVTDILRKAHEWGLTTRESGSRGGRTISRATLYYMFTNPFYAGILNFGGRQYAGRHTPVVTVAEFERVQTILGRTDRPRSEKHHFTYSRLLRCGDCGF